MFDAKKLLDAMVVGNSPVGAPGQGGIGDILNQLSQRAQPGQLTDGGGLGELLGQVLQQAGGAPANIASGVTPDGGTGGLGGMLGDLLGKAQDAAGSVGQSGNPVGDIAGMARDMLGKATSGVGEAARDLETSTGAGSALDQLIRQLSGGQGAGELLTRAQELVKNNPAAAGALAGVLGSLVLGTRTGRGLALDAAKLGGIVLIGGIAYKAYKNYQSGQTTSASAQGATVPAPSGTAFDAATQPNDHAITYLKAMIAAAAADGHIDHAERERIAGNLSRIGLDPHAQLFLEQEFANPASAAQLAAAASSPEVAAQIYAAARIVVEAESPADRTFLVNLAAALKLDPALVAHIDAAASSVKA